MPLLPIELLELILDNIAPTSESHRGPPSPSDLTTLSSLSLVCRPLCVLAQKRMFRCVRLTRPYRTTRRRGKWTDVVVVSPSARFEELILGRQGESRHIAGLVEELDLSDDASAAALLADAHTNHMKLKHKLSSANASGSWLCADTSLELVLPHLTSLRGLRISGELSGRRLRFDKFRKELQDAILGVCGRGLVRLRLEHVRQVPEGIFGRLEGVREVWCDRASFDLSRSGRRVGVGSSMGDGGGSGSASAAVRSRSSTRSSTRTTRSTTAAAAAAAIAATSTSSSRPSSSSSTPTNNTKCILQPTLLVLDDFYTGSFAAWTVLAARTLDVSRLRSLTFQVAGGSGWTPAPFRFLRSTLDGCGASLEKLRVFLLLDDFLSENPTEDPLPLPALPSLRSLSVSMDLYNHRRTADLRTGMRYLARQIAAVPLERERLRRFELVHFTVILDESFCEAVGEGAGEGDDSERDRQEEKEKGVDWKSLVRASEDLARELSASGGRCELRISFEVNRFTEDSARAYSYAGSTGAGAASDAGGGGRGYVGEEDWDMDLDTDADVDADADADTDLEDRDRTPGRARGGRTRGRGCRFSSELRKKFKKAREHGLLVEMRTMDRDKDL